MVAAIAIALLDRVRLEGQRPSDALAFLPRSKNCPELEFPVTTDIWGNTNEEQATRIAQRWPCGSHL